MTEPKPLAGPLVAARERLDSLRSSAAAVAPGPDLDPDDLAAIRDRGLADVRLQSWHMECPQRFHAATLDTIEPVARSAIDAWRRLRPRPNLVLLGPVGTGKTHAALAAVRDDYLDHGLETMFLPVVEALDLLRPGGPAGAMEDLLDVSRLVLDDVGAERPTDWTAERFGALVNRRWMEERPVIATSNLEAGDGKSLMLHLGERTYSRLVGSDAVVIRLSGEDRRRG